MLSLLQVLVVLSMSLLLLLFDVYVVTGRLQLLVLYVAIVALWPCCGIRKKKAFEMIVFEHPMAVRRYVFVNGPKGLRDKICQHISKRPFVDAMF